jgi:hypothetical protein
MRSRSCPSPVSVGRFVIRATLERGVGGGAGSLPRIMTTISTAEPPTRINEMSPNTNALPSNANNVDSETSVQTRSSSPAIGRSRRPGSALRRR